MFGFFLPRCSRSLAFGRIELLGEENRVHDVFERFLRIYHVLHSNVEAELLRSYYIIDFVISHVVNW